MNNKQSTLLVSWFKENQWDHLKEIVSDSDNLGETYADWKKQAEQHIGNFRSTGGIVKKISVDTEEMLAWANENNLKLETSNLSTYAMHLFEEKYPTMLVCWYKQEQWDHLKEIIVDSKKLGDSFEEWEEETEKNINLFRSKGQRVKKMLVDTEEMLQWAKANNNELTTDNVSSYATYLFERHFKARGKSKPKKKHNRKYGNNFYQ